MILKVRKANQVEEASASAVRVGQDCILLADFSIGLVEAGARRLKPAAAR